MPLLTRKSNPEQGVDLSCKDFIKEIRSKHARTDLAEHPLLLLRELDSQNQQSREPQDPPQSTRIRTATSV